MKKILLLTVAFVVSMATCSQTGGRRSQRGADAKGGVPFETKQSVFFSDGTLDEYTMSEWDRDFTHLNAQERYTASGAMIEQVEYSYNDDRNELLTKLTRDVERRLKNRVVYKHNPQGYLSQESLVDNKGKIVSTYEYAYDSAGNRTKRIIRNRAGDKLAETTYVFDTQRKMISSETSDYAESAISSTRYTYDSMGNLVSQQVMNGEGKITSTISTAWQDGRETQMEMASGDGALQMRISNEYGENGELIKKTIENFQGESKQVLQYEYIFRNVKG